MDNISVRPTALSYLDGGEDPGRLHHIVHATLAPRDLRGIALREHGDLVAVDDQLAVLGFDGAVEAAVRRVVLEHVDHVVEGHEGVVDGDHVDALGERGAEHDAPDATESVDSD